MKCGFGAGILAAALALAPPTAAQPGAGGANPLLDLPATVRSVGLNGAAAAMVGDAGAVFSNPSAIATVKHLAIEGMYRRAPGSARIGSVALVSRLRQFDLGVGAQRFHYGDTPAQYLGVASQHAQDLVGVGSVVYRFGLIALGASGRYARRTVDDVYTSGMSADAGIAIAFFDIMALAFSVQNIGGNWRDTSALAMPRRSRLGFTMNYVDPQEAFRLTSVLELQWPQGRSARLVFGGEAGIVVGGVGVIGRLAYGGAAAYTSGRAVTYGGSVRIGVANLDYAYRQRDVLGVPAHYFGLRLTL
jgi:hypothetical protein